MHQDVTELDLSLGKALDFDVGRDGSWVGIFQRGERLCVQLGDEREFFASSHLRYPRARFIGRENVLVVDTRYRGAPNAWIYDLNGDLIKAFPCGDGVADVVVLDDTIAVTYFDEGVFSNVPPSHEGIAFFDHQGRLIAGYQSMFTSEAVVIYDCYCACRVDDHTMAFSPYDAFPLVTLNPRAQRQIVRNLPRALQGAGAISIRDETVFLFSPRESKGVLFAWELDGTVRQLGECVGHLRGLEWGRFLSVGERGFTVLSFDAG
jgi:hypothetical protein